MPGRYPYLRKNTKKGFTLIELMITVAIIGVLAAVAIPVLSGYIQRSKASEAFTVLQGIRDKEEAYFGDYRRYTAPIPFYPGGNCNDTCAATSWNIARTWNPVPDAWKELGFNPDGPTYYMYSVTSPYNAAGVFNSGMARPANVGTSWPVAMKPWFMAEACGDLDCDGQPAHYYISSANKNVFAQEGDETY